VILAQCLLFFFRVGIVGLVVFAGGASRASDIFFFLLFDSLIVFLPLKYNIGLLIALSLETNH